MRSSTFEFDEVNYAKIKLDEATVTAIVAKAGSVAAVLNTRHAIAKEKGWATAPPSAAAFAKAVVAEPNLMRRPILIAGNKIIIGYDKPAYAKL